MSKQSQPASGEEAVKPSPRGNVSQQTIDLLDGILEAAHPGDLRRDFTDVLLHYIKHECHILPSHFKEVMQNYLLVLDMFEAIEIEMKAHESE
jgi:hypothetical protein